MDPTELQASGHTFIGSHNMIGFLVKTKCLNSEKAYLSKISREIQELLELKKFDMEAKPIKTWWNNSSNRIAKGCS